MPTPEITAEYDQLVAEFDETSSRPGWPGHRVLNNEGTEILANHVDDIELPDWADGDGIELPDWADGDGIELPDWATLDDDLDLDALVAGWADLDEGTQEATSSPQKADQERDEQKIEQAVVVGYRAAHARVKAAKGKASEQTCIDCGEQAREWSYDHGDPGQHIADDRVHAGKAYSIRVEHYHPRCRDCHKRFDKGHARARRGESTPPTVGWDGYSWAPEVGWIIRQRLRGMAGLDDQPLDDVLDLLRMHVAAQGEHDLAIVAAWIAATHLAALGVGQSFPRLAVVAPSHGAGKSTLLDLIEHLSHKGERIESTITDALLPRIIMKEGFVTLCIDEAEKVLKPENQNATAIINSGWRRGGTARLNLPHGANGWDSVKVPVFAPIAMAGNGVRLADDTLDRTITVRLYRNEDPDAINEADWTILKPVANRLRARLETWAEAMAGLPEVRKPPTPEGITGRDRDRWQVLSSVAEGTQRADWREIIRQACEADLAARQEIRDEAGRAPQEQLVVDLWEALPHAEAHPTEVMVKALADKFPDRYGIRSGKELTTHRLGWLLNKFWGLSSTKLNIDGGRRRGFTRASLNRPWQQVGIDVSNP